MSNRSTWIKHARLTALASAVIATGTLLSEQAPAEWPPPESFTANDMKDPANWPNDPGYGYNEDSDGQWNYYSFLPEQSGSLKLRPEETASGMSIDLAWRYTRGDDRVRIAITDSGIEWDSSDLIDRAWLNPVELANHKPTQADGGVCGGNGDLAGYDCNDDGIFSVSDYAVTPTLDPPAGPNQVLGDKNHNGLLDAGDIILNFSDGVDDDNNGYVDDISGWDFMKDDNNPYDDTRYGHGTGEANDSTAEGNNGRGGIGGCHLCRFIPMRVGDSFIADVTAFGQALVYATDNGAKIIQCALGTINMNSFAQSALDYAYANNVLAVTSMADENARHHNLPATANHTLPVHAITYYPENGITNVQSFLNFNACTNFGGQNLLSVSGKSCSSEAVGQLAGMSGLIYSAALKYGYPDLTPGEAQQLWIKTTDDIDVPESREEETVYYWSQPGFDQRFGYGRVNANTALEWVKNGRIPPEVDMVRPYWFEVLYRDQVQGPVAIKGTIAAKRANSYDWVLEWAPGVQPLEGMFQKVAGQDNVPSSVVTGGVDPIADFDIRTIDVTHEPDSDSPHGENEHTITVRIRATAHYGGSVGDVPGEMRRTYYVHSDPDLVKGFPMYIGDSGELSPKLADMDGDGIRDIIYSTTAGRIHVLKITPTGPKPIDGWPFVGELVDGLRETPPDGLPSYRSAPGYNGGVDPQLAGDSFSIAPAVADVDGDGKPEVVASTWNGNIYVIEHDGTVKASWRLPLVPSCPRDGSAPAGPCSNTDALIDTGTFAAPVLEDMDKDGDLDIIQAAFDGKVYVWDIEGNALPGWPVEVHYNGTLTEEPEHNRILTTAAVGDFNGDGIPEVLVGSNERLGAGKQVGAVYLIDGRGTTVSPTPWLSNWPVAMTSFNLFPLVAEGVPNAGVIGNLDGTLVAIAHGNASAPFLLPADPGGQSTLSATPEGALPQVIDEGNGKLRKGVAPTSRYGKLSKAFRPNTMFPLFAQPSLGDIDQDGTLDVIASGGSLTVANSLLGTSNQPGEHLLAMWSGKTGEMLPASPMVLEDFSFFNSHAVVDLNGDDYPEVLAGSGGYFLHAWDGCGREPAGWPKFTGQWIIPTPAVGDLDGDGKLEVVTGTRSGWLYAWHTEGKSDGMIQWESFHHDNRNTGNYATPLDQGDPSRKAAEPMTTEWCEAALAVPGAGVGDLSPSGGCGCYVAGAPARPRAGWLALLLGAGLLARRRRD